jgi:hypothetical protein
MAIKLIYGDEQVTTGPRENTENQLFGPGWIVTRSNGRCVAEFDSGEHGGGTISFEISDEDFDVLKADSSLGEVLYRKYSQIRGDGWWADRSARGCYIRVTDHVKYSRTGDFFVDESDFNALRNNPDLFGTLYSKHMKS